MPDTILREYSVIPLQTSLIGGALDPNQLQAQLNGAGRGGWKFVRTIHESKRVLGIFKREAHFLVFERERE